MKHVNCKKRRYFTIIIIILTVLIFGLVKLDYLSVQAESMDPGDEDKLLEIIQGDFLHRFVRGSEGITFQLDVKDPELDVQYDWHILVPPMHGGALVSEDGISTEVFSPDLDAGQQVVIGSNLPQNNSSSQRSPFLPSRR